MSHDGDAWDGYVPSDKEVTRLLVARTAQLEVDAARYRWLRLHWDEFLTCANWKYVCVSDLDAAIDTKLRAAIRKAT